MLAAIDRTFVAANCVEAALWGVIGVGFLVHAVRRRNGRWSIIAAAAFLVFAASDVIETRTGAWWRPWWLLAMKGGCVGAFLMLLANHYAARGRVIPDTARPRSSTRPSR